MDGTKVYVSFSLLTIFIFIWWNSYQFYKVYHQYVKQYQTHQFDHILYKLIGYSVIKSLLVILSIIGIWLFESTIYILFVFFCLWIVSDIVKLENIIVKNVYKERK